MELALSRLATIGFQTIPGEASLAQRITSYREYQVAYEALGDQAEQLIEHALPNEQEEYRRGLSPSEMYRADLKPWQESLATLSYSLIQATPETAEEHKITTWIQNGVPFLLRKGWPFLIFNQVQNVPASTHRYFYSRDIVIRVERQFFNVCFQIGNSTKMFFYTPKLPGTFRIELHKVFEGLLAPCIIDPVNHYGPFSLHPSQYQNSMADIYRIAKQHERLKSACLVVKKETCEAAGFENRIIMTVAGPNGSSFRTWPLWHGVTVGYESGVPQIIVNGSCYYLVSRYVGKLLGITSHRLYDTWFNGSSMLLDESLWRLSHDNTKAKDEEEEEKKTTEEKNSVNPRMPQLLAMARKFGLHICPERQIPRTFDFPVSGDAPLQWNLGKMFPLFCEMRKYLRSETVLKQKWPSSFHCLLSSQVEDPCIFHQSVEGGEPAVHTEEAIPPAYQSVRNKLYQMGTSLIKEHWAECMTFNIVFSVFAVTRFMKFGEDFRVSNLEELFDPENRPPKTCKDVRVLFGRLDKKRCKSHRSKIPMQMFDASKLSASVSSMIACRPLLHKRTCAYISVLVLLLYFTDDTPRTRIIFEYLNTVQKEFENVEQMIYRHSNFVMSHGFCETCHQFVESNGDSVFCTRHKGV